MTCGRFKDGRRDGGGRRRAGGWGYEGRVGEIRTED